MHEAVRTFLYNRCEPNKWAWPQKFAALLRRQFSFENPKSGYAPGHDVLCGVLLCGVLSSHLCLGHHQRNT